MRAAGGWCEMGDVEKVGGTKEGDSRGEGEDNDDSSNTKVKLGVYLTLWTWKSAEARGLWELTDEGYGGRRGRIGAGGRSGLCRFRPGSTMGIVIYGSLES